MSVHAIDAAPIFLVIAFPASYPLVAAAFSVVGLIGRPGLMAFTRWREAAADAYERALALCGNGAERAYLQRRLDEMLGHGW